MGDNERWMAGGKEGEEGEARSGTRLRLDVGHSVEKRWRCDAQWGATLGED